MLLEVILFTAIFAYAFYHWATINNDLFEKRGIPHQKPRFLFGGMKDVIFRKISFFDAMVKLYNETDAKMYGFFDQRKPVLVVKDPDMIKQITVKDFDHFANHRDIFTINDKELFANGLFLMKDGKWKDMRSTLTPIFTGRKLREMFILINEVAEVTVAALKKETAAHKTNGFDIDVKDFCTRISNDVIFSTAFGLKVNSYEDKTNQFYKTGLRVLSFSTWQDIKFFLITNFKPIMKFLDLSLFDKKHNDFFMRIVLDAMKYRKEHNYHRPDLIQLMMEARGMLPTDTIKSHNREWTDLEVVAQCFLFLIGGFDTTATLMCFAAHELMENQQVQARLLDEVLEVDSELDGKPITYEKLMGMKYMDMVVQETQRKWPIAFFIDRVCNKDFVYESDGERFEIKAGDTVWIPTSGFHRDPKYFEDPLKFDPERFSDENKTNIPPFVYMPFGVGPRLCIGNRFAMLEAKAFLFYLLRDFHIEAAKNSMIPLEVIVKSLQIFPKNGFWLKFIPRH